MGVMRERDSLRLDMADLLEAARMAADATMEKAAAAEAQVQAQVGGRGCRRVRDGQQAVGMQPRCRWWLWTPLTVQPHPASSACSEDGSRGDPGVLAAHTQHNKPEYGHGCCCRAH